jgi:NitT/TauT family transport system ATP-binding protein
MTALEIDIQAKRFPSADGAPAQTVLRDVVLAVEAAQFLCILGPSGCGKTTLLNLIAGLDQDFEGRISIAREPGRDRPRIGYVFQNPTLLPWRSVIENLRLVMADDQIARGLDLALLDAMGLLDYRDAYPKSLSLGMSRRVALARAFAVEPDLLLMDEPFVSLDESTADGLRRLLLQIWQAKPTTVLFVTHDSREAIQLAQRIIVLCASPATIVRDQSIALTAAQRADPLQLEALREQIR